MSNVSFSPIASEELEAGDNLLQSPFWARLKERHGWQSYAFRVNMAAPTLLVLVRRFRGGIGLAYVPHGPDERLGHGEEPLAEIAGEVEKRLPAGVAVLRFDPRWTHPLDNGRLRKLGVASGAVEVQPSNTVLIDLSQGEESLLAQMKSKWRYNVRLAAKRGVSVRVSGSDELRNDFERWYRMYERTAVRDRIAIHSSEYYRDFLIHDWYTGPERGKPSVDLRLAEHDGDLLAGIITARIGSRATYVFGASEDLKRNLMPSYALQWNAMRDAMEAGCSCYDMFGIPPAEDENHPMHGLYRFKTGFGGRHVSYCGTWDRVLRPLAGRAFRVAERARDYYYKRLRKR